MCYYIYIKNQRCFMSLYTGCKCDACQNIFKKDDDVIVCPICGTPHHRLCYKNLNNCVHADKHESDYAWESADFKGFEEDTNNYQNNNSYANGYTTYDNNNVIVEGITSEDLKNYFGVTGGYKFTRIFTFINKTRMRKFSIAAFIFGPYYYIFRKMTKKGLILLAIHLALLAPTFILGIESIKYLIDYTNIAPMAYNQTLISALTKITNLTNILTFVLRFYCGRNAMTDLYNKTIIEIKEIKSNFVNKPEELKTALRFRGKSNLLLAILLFIAIFFIIEFVLTRVTLPYAPYMNDLMQKIIQEGIRVTNQAASQTKI